VDNERGLFYISTFVPDVPPRISEYMKQALVVFFLLIALGLVLSCLFHHPAQKKVSMLLLNGIVYTVDDQHPRAAALAIEGDRIVGVGSTSDIVARFAADRVIDLHGRAVYPGFTDSHAHLEGLGAALLNINLGDARSEEEAVQLIAAAARNPVKGGWIRGRGWDQNRWPGAKFPTAHSLDKVCENIPVFLRRVDGHAVWVNSRVLVLAGIDQWTPDPPGGKIVRDSRNRPTGVLVDNAATLVEKILPAPTEEERTEAIRQAVKACLAVGLTEVHDMGVDAGGVALYGKMISAGEFPFRVYVALEGSIPGLWDSFRKAGPVTTGFDGKLRVRALKMYADGALGSRGAALFDSYTDDPGNRGLTLTSRAELLQRATEALQSGFQLCTHAIGDRANGLVLDVYEEAFKSVKEKSADPRFRVEHAQVLSPGDIARFHTLGVLPMMQPTHCTSDMPWAETRLGPVRIKGAYAWRSLLAKGSIVPAGSDFPVESPNPLLGFYAAITRQDREGQPAGGWYPEQKMTREEALKAFTLWGAMAGFREKEKGSLEVGKLADIAVLEDDIMTIPPEKIPGARVAMTIVGGTIAYERVPSGAAPRE
jgi:predicted amidohydrolase YtcJ